MNALVMVWLLLSAATAAAQNASIARVYFGASDGRAHVVSVAGKDTAIAPEKDQAGIQSAQLSEDRTTAGWLVEYPNCCTSYPVALTLVIYRSGRIVRRLTPGWMIFDWRFLEGGKKIAMSAGTVHGMTYRSLSLYDVVTGRMEDHWDGAFEATPPAWARELKQ